MTITTIRELLNIDDPTEIKTRTFKSELVGSILIIKEVTVDENNQEIERTLKIQPWKPNPDGTRSDWIDEDDASSWVESIKNTL
jgi:hypothetical protein